MSLKRFLRDSSSKIFSFGPIRVVTSLISGNYAVVFMMHRFDGYSPTFKGDHEQEFVREILAEVRKLNLPVVPVDHIFEARKGKRILGKNVIAFTMDDGFLDQALIGAEIFLEYDCPATIFVVSDFLDDTYWLLHSKIDYIIRETKLTNFTVNGLDGVEVSICKNTIENSINSKIKLIEVIRNLSVDKALVFVEALAKKCEVDLPEKAPYDYRPMTWNDARKLEKRGISIGAHTCKHPVLSMESDESSAFEIKNSFTRICNELENPSKVFCYPTGRYSDFSSREMQYIEEAGYIGAVNAENGYMYALNSVHNNDFSVNRFTFPDSVGEFKQYALRIEYFKEYIRNSFK